MRKHFFNRKRGPASQGHESLASHGRPAQRRAVEYSTGAGPHTRGLHSLLAAAHRVFPVVLNSSPQAVPQVVAKHCTEKALPGPGPGLGKKDASNPLSPLPSPSEQRQVTRREMISDLSVPFRWLGDHSPHSGTKPTLGRSCFPGGG